MQKKQETFNKLWHDDNWLDQNVAKAEEFDYSGIDILRLFNDTHPEVMKDRINKKNWTFNFDISKNKRKTKDKIKHFFDKIGIKWGQYKKKRHFFLRACLIIPEKVYNLPLS